MQYACFYQCAWWRQLGIQNVLLKSGIILAASAIIERCTSLVTTNLGLRFISEGSTVRDVKNALDWLFTKPPSWHVMKLTLSLFFFYALQQASTYLTPKFDRDGYFTVDYYVTLVFMFSLLSALFVRNVQPFRMMPVVYTKKLWTEGKDEFVGLKNGHKHNVDLFEWLHMLPIQRALLLAKKARFINVPSLPHYHQTLATSVDEKFQSTYEMAELKKLEAQSSAPTGVHKKETSDMGPTSQSAPANVFSWTQERLLATEQRLDNLESKSLPLLPKGIPTNTRSGNVRDSEEQRRRSLNLKAEVGCVWGSARSNLDSRKTKMLN
jgi:hypothetical protein